MAISETIFNVVDVETTGLDPARDKIVEFACVPCSIKNGVMHDLRFSGLVNPGVKIHPAASAIHHITDEMMPDAKPLPELLSVMGPGPLVAHCAAFDSAFLNLGEPFLCTMRLAQKLWPDLDGYGNQFLRYYFKLDIPGQIAAMPMHRALPDAIVTAYLLLYELAEVIKRSKEPDSITVHGLIEWIEKPILLSVCRFGKHKGTKWSAVPKDYLQWALSPNGMTDMDVDLRFTIEHYLQVGQ